MKGSRIAGIRTTHGEDFGAAAVVIRPAYTSTAACIRGLDQPFRPSGLQRARSSQSLAEDCGLVLRRFKTGTHPVLTEKPWTSPNAGAAGRYAHRSFFFLTPPETFDGFEQTPCYLTYTNEKLTRFCAPIWIAVLCLAASSQERGARYCPSIEDKVVRFADKPRHQLFIEPEGLYTTEKYVQGFSTSMPLDVQKEALATIPGWNRPALYAPDMPLSTIASTALR